MLVFNGFKKNVHIVRQEVVIDNIVFRLHYRITLWFLFACSVLVGSREYIKEHISCVSDKYLKHVINTYCFFSTTFSVVKYHNNAIVNNSLIVHPGVGPYSIRSSGGEDLQTIRHAYYQWVPFVLFAQALIFYLPHLYWKQSEKGRLKAIVNYMRTSKLTASVKQQIKGLNIDTSDAKQEKIDWLKSAYLTSQKIKANSDWGFNLILSELFNLTNLTLQIVLVNQFLQGNFYNLGTKWLYSEEGTLDMVFPKVTKCTFHKYGPTGSVQVHDTICVMALNIINEKIYCVLWFWFLALFIMTSLGLLWRMLTYFLHKKTFFNKFVWGELSPGPRIIRKNLIVVSSTLHFTDWLFLYYLGKNIDGVMFRNLVAQLAESVNGKKAESFIMLEASPSLKRYTSDESTC